MGGTKLAVEGAFKKLKNIFMGNHIIKIGRFIKDRVPSLPLGIARMGDSYGTCDCSWCHAMEYEMARDLSKVGWEGNQF
jgi:hypothetical protein